MWFINIASEHVQAEWLFFFLFSLLFAFEYMDFDVEWCFRSSLERMQIEQIGIGQLHWSTANYAPPQELALWDGLVAMYEKVTMNLSFQ